MSRSSDNMETLICKVVNIQILKHNHSIVNRMILNVILLNMEEHQQYGIILSKVRTMVCVIFQTFVLHWQTHLYTSPHVYYANGREPSGRKSYYTYLKEWSQESSVLKEMGDRIMVNLPKEWVIEEAIEPIK